MKVRSAGRVLVALIGLSFLAAGCEKVSLVAPSGSTITLTAQATALPANGTTDLIAQVLEAAGTPPHSGTVITFTTTLGGIEPSEARTDTNGRVIVKFRAGNNNGTATITATSGGARTGADGAVKIAIGSAAVGKVALNANPNPVSANAGRTTITANVIDINGNALGAVPVAFSTTAGSLANSLVNTEADGVARTTLVTSVQATVTATVGVQGATGGTGSTGGSATNSVQVNVNPLPNVQIAAQGTNFIANSPITFTITAQPGTGSTAQIRSVKVDFGDGDTVDLGAVSGTNITVQHRYEDDDTYTVRVTVVDSFGDSVSAATSIVVQPEPPLGVNINVSKAGTLPTVTVSFTATVTPATATVATYVWNFGDGSPPATTTSNQTVHVYNTANVYTVTVTVTTSTGKTATGQTAFSVP